MSIFRFCYQYSIEIFYTLPYKMRWNVVKCPTAKNAWAF
ncbi:hypothetical protein HPSA20_0149 [Helicobacter pylori SouthAfrica20]|uniref:Uncharacterized protein n=1 Tax=Helicobacter pylori SouthAfrica20 TaxID=1352356 RepID=T1U8Y9_HELPX|nr:hypothetical protein HPSA20_0149 [Helicobacter pylori SouthAfrica20]